MPNGIYVFGGSKFSKQPFLNGPIISKFLENGSNVWTNGPNFPHELYVHIERYYTSFEISAGHRISNEEFILILNRYVLKYNINRKNWSYLFRLKHTRRQSCSFVCNNLLFIAGGYEVPSGNILDSTEIVHLKLGHYWYKKLNIPRVDFKIGIFNVENGLQIVAYGGKYETSSRSQFIEIWHWRKMQWKLYKLASGGTISKLLVKLSRKFGYNRDQIFRFKYFIAPNY